MFWLQHAHTHPKSVILELFRQATNEKETHAESSRVRTVGRTQTADGKKKEQGKTIKATRQKKKTKRQARAASKSCA